MIASMIVHAIAPTIASAAERARMIALPAADPAGDPPALGLLDLHGKHVDPLADGRARATVVIFARTDCPISNRYAPELRRLHDRFAKSGVAFWLVYPDPTESARAIRTHVKEYGFPFGALRDPKHELVALAKATVTPEAAVFTPDRTMVYRGRIDDWFVDFGKTRPAPTQHDLEKALEAVLDGKLPAAASTVAIGCFIGPLP